MQETIEEIALADVYLDRDTQIRAEASEETIQRYYDAMIDIAARDKFPPILLFRDINGRLWLADGHHRVMAAIRRKFKTILAIIRPGSKADAIWEAAKANGKNGLQLGRADVRRTIEMILDSCKDKSLRAIAENVGCSKTYVEKIKDQLSTSGQLTLPEKILGKDGKLRSSKRSPKEKSEAMVSGLTSFVPKPTETNVMEAAIPTTPLRESVVEVTERIESEPDPEKALLATEQEARIMETIDMLERQITEWFDIAPSELIREFEHRIQMRIRKLID